MEHWLTWLRDLSYRLRSWRWRLKERWMGTCRVCGRGNGDGVVYVYDPRGLWAYPWRRTWCPEHCPEHDYDHERGEGWRCRHCGDSAPYDYMVDRG